MLKDLTTTGPQDQNLCGFMGSLWVFAGFRALDLLNLGPKFGLIPKAKKYVFFPILDEKFPVWPSMFGSEKYQV